MNSNESRHRPAYSTLVRMIGKLIEVVSIEGDPTPRCLCRSCVQRRIVADARRLYEKAK